MPETTRAPVAMTPSMGGALRRRVRVTAVLLLALALPAFTTGAAARPMVDAEAAIARVERTAGGPGRAALEASLGAYRRALALGLVPDPSILTVIDYTRPSSEPRLWVLDLRSGRILHRELVSHGHNSGDNLATAFSNEHGSLKSSLGLFVTDRTYYGQNGYSLRLHGLDAGVNDNAFARAIVMHGAPYVSQRVVAQLGRLGRSWGCPALRPQVARTIIDRIKEGTVVFAYGPPLAGGVPTTAAASDAEPRQP